MTIARIARLFFLTVSAVGLYALSVHAQTAVQFGINRGTSPNQIGVYDSQNVFQPFMTIPASGGGPLTTLPSTTTKSGFNITPGVAPTFPNNGDVWTTSAGMYVQINGITVGPLSETGSGSFAATFPLVVSFSEGVATYSLNYDSAFALSNNKLALAPIASGALLGNSSGSAAEPSAVQTGSGVLTALGNPLNGSGGVLSTSLASADLFIGNSSGIAAGVPMSGDATISNAGALTLSPSGVTAGTYGDGTHSTQVTFDAKGRATAAASVTITHASGDLAAANNLSDVASVPTARTNLGLGNLATQNAGTGLANSGGNLNLQPATSSTIGGVKYPIPGYSVSLDLVADYGAKCDGTTDDTAAIQNWLNAAAANVHLTMPAGKCVFTSALTIPHGTNYAITGAGPYASVLLYEGSNTTNDLVTLGDSSHSSTGIFIGGLRIASNTVMTGGMAFHAHGLFASMVENFVLDGLNDGNGDLWGAAWFDGAGGVQLTNFDFNSAQAGGDGIEVNSALGGTADLYISKGRVHGFANGLHEAGGFGGFTCAQTDVNQNTVGLRVDDAIIAVGNREFDQHGGCAFDSSTDDNVYINDPDASGGTINLGDWIASSQTANGVNVVSWPSGQIEITGHELYNNCLDGLYDQDSTTHILIDGAVAIRNNGNSNVSASCPAAQTSHPTQGWGLNANSATTGILDFAVPYGNLKGSSSTNTGVSAAAFLGMAQTWSAKQSLPAIGLTQAYSGSGIFGTTGAYIQSSGTLTDTSSTGTVATAYGALLGGHTWAASNATTVTAAVGTDFEPPIAGTNVTLTDSYSARFGGGDGPLFISAFGTPVVTVKSGVIKVLNTNGAEMWGFGSIYDASLGDNNINVGVGVLHGTQNVAFPGTTDASSSTTGNVQDAGGLGVAKSAWVGTFLNLKPTVIASLPTCNAAAEGSLIWIKDTQGSAAPTYHGIVAGGGSTAVDSLVSCNGSSWQYD